MRFDQLSLIEPDIHNFSDGLWYTFVSCSTIGFGDITVTTLWGRLLTAYIAIAEIMTVAVISGVVVSYYLEVIHRRDLLSAAPPGLWPERSTRPP